MRVLHFSTYDSKLGAGHAAYRIHSALLGAGHSSWIVVKEKETDDKYVVEGELPQSGPSIFADRMRARLNLGFYGTPEPASIFNTNIYPALKPGFLNKIGTDSIDIIALHSVGSFLRIDTIRRIYEYFKKPIVWTLHNQEPLTGGCFYPLECPGYRQSCGNCPELFSDSGTDLSRKIWSHKQKTLTSLPITFAATCEWLATSVRSSSLFGAHRVKTIPLPFNPDVFKPRDMLEARKKLDIPENKKVIFFAAGNLNEPRKGTSYFSQAMNMLSGLCQSTHAAVSADEVYVIIAGHGAGKLVESLPFDGKALGFIESEKKMALAYNASNIHVSTSLYDSGPTTVSEAMLCGVPVVSFPTGIAPDLIVNMQSGYLAKYKDINDLARTIYKVLSITTLTSIREAARKSAFDVHNPAKIAASYVTLYETLSEKLKNQESVDSQATRKVSPQDLLQ